MKTLSLGMDIGTSKICVTVFEIDTQKIKCLTFNNEVIIPTKVAISISKPEVLKFSYELSGNEMPSEYIIIESTKRCVICEWYYEIGKKEFVKEQNCLNHRNYNNQCWCNRGRQEFTFKKYQWKPSDIFIQLFYKTIELTEGALEKEYGQDYAIQELKVGAPMIFHKKDWYIQWLDSKVKAIANTGLVHKLRSDAIIKIVHEPIATLMAHTYGKKRDRALPPGNLIVVDAGAGTTDIVLCQKKADKISFVDFDSWNIAGDDYDKAMEGVIRNEIFEQRLGLNNEQVNKIARENAKIQKEYYCQSHISPTISLPSFKPITLNGDRIDRAFAKVNERIVSNIKNFMEKHNKAGLAIRKVYLSGGCINVLSLINGVQEALNVQPDDCVEVYLADSDIAHDPVIVSVSIGASISQSQYENIVVYSLPFDIIIEEEIDSKDIEERYKKVAHLYKAKQEDCHGKIHIDVPFQKILIFRTITLAGNRREITRINTARFFKEKKHNILKLTVEYFVDYNGKLKLLAFSNHLPEKKEIFDDFVMP